MRESWEGTRATPRALWNRRRCLFVIQRIIVVAGNMINTCFVKLRLSFSVSNFKYKL